MTWQIIHGRWQDHAPESVDVIISDPPFTDHVSENMRSSGPRGADSLTAVRSYELSFGGVHPEDFVADFLRIASRWVLCFCAIEQVGAYEAAAKKVDPACWVRGGVWVKTNPTPQLSGDRPAQWGEAYALMHAPRESGPMRWNGGGHPAKHIGPYHRGERYHETQKPLWLMRELVNLYSEPGELVWDPFCGSGTTGVAAVVEGRDFLGHEAQQHYAEVARERLSAREQGLTIEDARRGQGSLFGVGL